MPLTGTVVHERNAVIAMWVRTDSFQIIRVVMWPAFENEAKQASRGGGRPLRLPHFPRVEMKIFPVLEKISHQKMKSPRAF